MVGKVFLVGGHGIQGGVGMDLGERKRPGGKGGKEPVYDRSYLGLGMVVGRIGLRNFGEFRKDSIPIFAPITFSSNRKKRSL